MKDDLKFAAAVAVFSALFVVVKDAPAALHDPAKINVRMTDKEFQPRLDEERFRRNMVYIRKIKEGRNQ